MSIRFLKILSRQEVQDKDQGAIFSKLYASCCKNISTARGASHNIIVFLYFRDITILNTIEKSVTAGDTLVLYNIEDEIDPFLFPIIDHLNTKSRLHSDEGNYSQQTLILNHLVFEKDHCRKNPVEATVLAKLNGSTRFLPKTLILSPSQVLVLIQRITNQPKDNQIRIQDHR